MKHSSYRLPAAILCALCLSIIACFGTQNNNVSVQPAPLEKEKSTKLEALLVGQWHYKETRTSAQGKGYKNNGDMAWALDKAGSFVYQQRTGLSGTVSGKWWLDGRNLHFRSGGNGTLSAYRIEEWSSGQMIWYSYREQTYFLVERIGLIQASHTTDFPK